MPGQGPQPAAKAFRGVVGERPHLVGQFDQHDLRDVLDVGVLQPGLTAPGEDEPAVALDELFPGRLIAGLLPQPAQKRRAGLCAGSVVHRTYAFRGRNWTPPARQFADSAKRSLF